jgi:hypothetical protein
MGYGSLLQCQSNPDRQIALRAILLLCALDPPIFPKRPEAYFQKIGGNRSHGDRSRWVISCIHAAPPGRFALRPRGKPRQWDVEVPGITCATARSIHRRFLPVCGTAAPSMMHQDQTGGGPIKNKTLVQSMHYCGRAYPFRARQRGGWQVTSHSELFCSVQRKKMIAVSNFQRLFTDWPTGTPPTSQDCPKPMMRGTLKATTAVHNHEYIHN